MACASVGQVAAAVVETAVVGTAAVLGLPAFPVVAVVGGDAVLLPELHPVRTRPVIKTPAAKDTR